MKRREPVRLHVYIQRLRGSAVQWEFREGLIENLRDLIDPVGVFGFHQDGTEAGDGISITLDFRGRKIEEGHGQSSQGEVQILARRFGEDLS